MVKSPVCYQLKVVLDHIKPQIWRRIMVPGSLTVRQLHTILQVVMNWEESHLHVFQIQDKEYGDPQDDETGTHPILDEHQYRLDRVVPRQVGFRFLYTYDFGDTWEHVLLVEKIVPPEECADRPVCLDGKRAGPLEDSGGPYGYMELVEALKDPENPENVERLEWAGEDFDPEAFDLKWINQELDRLVEADYQLEAMFIYKDEDEDEDFLEELEEALTSEAPEPIRLSSEDFRQLFEKWAQLQTQELQEICENLRLRKDYLVLLSYLRDHKVKGTATTGNLPLKAVREINAGFVYPQPLETEGHKVRSEEQVPDLLFLHAMAYSRELLDGGPQTRWELTEEGQAFLGLPPSVQVLDMFLSWLLHMDWSIMEFPTFPEDQQIEVQKAAVQILAQLPAGSWILVNRLAEQIAEAAGQKTDKMIGLISGKEFWTLSVFAQLIMPMLLFEVFEGKKGTDYDTFEVRLTPLGSALLITSQEIFNRL